MRTRTIASGLAIAGVATVLIAGPAAAHGDGVEDETDLTTLPVGETVTEPTVGGLWSCQSSFSENAAGAQTAGPWFNGDGTWDATKKYAVDGDVDWPNAELTVTKKNGKRLISTNNLPTIHTTGEFPIAADDDAYQIDRNPSSPTSRHASAVRSASSSPVSCCSTRSTPADATPLPTRSRTTVTDTPTRVGTTTTLRRTACSRSWTRAPGGRS